MNMNGWSKTKTRKVFQSIALIMPAATLVLLSKDGAADNAANAILAFSTATGFAALSVAGFGSSVLDLSKPNSRLIPIIYSLTSLPSVLIGSIGTWSVGKILDATGDWNLCFLGIASVYTTGALFFVMRFKVPEDTILLL